MPFKGLAGVVPRGPYSVMQICLAWQTPRMRLPSDERGDGMARIGALEAGGTKMVLSVGTSQGEVLE